MRARILPERRRINNFFIDDLQDNELDDPKNYIVSATLPASLTYLNWKNVSREEGGPIQVYNFSDLPPQLVTLKVDHSFSWKTPPLLPNTLKHLKINNASLPDLAATKLISFSWDPRVTNNKLPFLSHLNFKFLEKLELGPNYKVRLPYFQHLTELSCHVRLVMTLAWVPPLLTHLTVVEDDTRHYNMVDKLPSTLTSFKIHGFAITCPLDILPASLTHLTLGESFSLPVDNMLPPNLKKLKFRGNFDGTVDALPSNLESLKFKSGFNQTVDFLPATLRKLKFTRKFNQPVNNIPPLLTHFKFGKNFNQPIDNLPTSITHMKFGKYFRQHVSSFPTSLTHLSVKGKYCRCSFSDLPKGIRFEIEFSKQKYIWYRLVILIPKQKCPVFSVFLASILP